MSLNKIQREMEPLTVNSVRNIAHEVNIRLSKQMKKVLQFLYQHNDHIFQQIEIISAIYDDPEITFSRIASMSRTIKTLTKAQLVTSRNKFYSEYFQIWWPDRVRYFLTEKGIQFVKERLGVEKHE